MNNMLKKSYTEHTISSDKARIGVTTKGCAVTSWEVKDVAGVFTDLLYQGSTLQRTGIPLCFPYFGQREGQSGKHGFGRDSIWRLVATDASCVKLHLTHEEISESAQKAYPFAFAAEVALTVGKDGSLAYALQVKNTGEEPLPLSPGLHPYWHISHAEKKEIVIPMLKDFDAKQIDWDTNPPDTVYPFTDSAQILLPNRTVTVYDLSRPKTITHLVVWSQSPDKPDSEYVCVEPVTRTPEEAPLFVAPGEAWNMQIQFTASI